MCHISFLEQKLWLIIDTWHLSTLKCIVGVILHFIFFVTPFHFRMFFLRLFESSWFRQVSNIKIEIWPQLNNKESVQLHEWNMTPILAKLKFRSGSFKIYRKLACNMTLVWYLCNMTPDRKLDTSVTFLNSHVAHFLN